MKRGVLENGDVSLGYWSLPASSTNRENRKQPSRLSADNRLDHLDGLDRSERDPT